MKKLFKTHTLVELKKNVYHTGSCLDIYKENKYLSYVTAVLLQLPKVA